jgi:tellurite resistance protein
MIDRLQPEEQRVMLELLIYLAKADGTVADIEQEILQNYATLVEVDFSSLDGNLTPEILIPKLTSPVSRAVVLQELLRLSHLDGVFSQGEGKALLNVADRMGFPVDLVQRLDEWVVDGLKWVWRGEDLLDEIESDYGG